MSLEYYRSVVMQKLASGKAFERANVDSTMRDIDFWWIAYKAWEKRDTFLGAFKEGRMTVRQIPVPKGMEAMPVHQINDYDINYGNYKGQESSIAFGARHGLEEKKLYPNERYRVGTTALKERLDPSNFGMDRGERLKYRNGLHDLSASLCVPTIPNLTQQVRWKWGELTARITVFMPLARPEDIQLFSALNAAAKRERDTSPQIYLQVSEMRKRMTRIKLADSVDIGAGLHDVSAPGSDTPKFRYGMKEVPVDGKPIGIDLERAQKALNYTSILPPAPKVVAPPKIIAPPPVTSGGAPPPPMGPPPPMMGSTATTTSCNEVVIAYREHAGDRFPLFTKFDMQEKAFICHPNEPSSRWIERRRIPNSWAQTVEV